VVDTSLRTDRDRTPILMIAHAYYEEDPRVRRQAESLVEAGYPVTVVALRRAEDAPHGDVAGVAVHRLNVQRHQGAGLLVYLREYLAFLLRASWRSFRLHRQRRFALVQVHSLPDFLVFAALPLRLGGVPVVLDLHEAMPEFFRSRFPRASNLVVHALLRWQERLAIAFSSMTLTVNEKMRSRLIGTGVRENKIAVILNSPSLALFDREAYPVRRFRQDDSLRLVYTGALTPTYELDLVVRAIAQLAEDRPELDLRLDFFGRGDSEPSLRERAIELGLARRVVFHGRIPIDEVPAVVARADIGLAPTRSDRFTDMSLSTKVFEYAAMGKPVVASRLGMVERLFGDAVFAYEPGDAAALEAAILRVVDEPRLRATAVSRATEIVRDNSWEREGLRYLEIIARVAKN
jgi:glycosyltransferase involved in cell wall biosynthesis